MKIKASYFLFCLFYQCMGIASNGFSLTVTRPIFLWEITPQQPRNSSNF